MDKQQPSIKSKYNRKKIDQSFHVKAQPYPTFGSPTIPHFNDVPNRPINGVGFSSSFFFGGILTRNEREKHRTNNLLSRVAKVDEIVVKWRTDITEHTLVCEPLEDMFDRCLDEMLHAL